MSLAFVNRSVDIFGSFFRSGLSYFTISCIFLLSVFSDSPAQVNKSISADILYNYFNAVYGLDQNLVNGSKYYKSNESVSGNEFFMDAKSSRGKITVNGINYPDVFLKYDLVNQDIILEYDFPAGGKMQIIIDNEKITEFEILGKTFMRYHFPSTGDQFFQTIFAADMVCLIHWTKQRIPTSSSIEYAYQYSEENRKTYLLREDQLYRFTGGKSFLKLFPETKDEIKKYIKRYKLELRNISDNDLVRLLEYCSDSGSNTP